jgi:hypothetical protein
VSYHFHNHGRFVFIRWGQKTELADIDRLKADVAAVRRKVRAPLLMFSIAPASSDPPEAGVGKALVRRWDELMPPGDRVCAVLEGEGLRKSLYRAFATAMRTLLLHRHGVGKIYDSLEAAMREESVSVSRDELAAAAIL